MSKITMTEKNGKYLLDVKREFGDQYQKVFESLDEASEYIKGFSNYCKEKGYKFVFEDLIHKADNSVGRPSLGITKKISLTLPEDLWTWLDQGAKGNRSEFLRYMINQEKSPESRWSNNACLGYAVLGAKKLNYSDDEIKILIRAIYSEFDRTDVDQAKNAYNESPF